MPMQIEDADAESLPAGPSGGRQRSILRLLQPYGLLLVWLVVLIAFSVLKPTQYLSIANAANMLGTQAVLVFVSLALIFVFRVGDYDLSVAANLTMSSVLIGVLNAQQGWPIAVVIVLCLLMGIGIGLVNSYFIVVIGIDSIVVTLGTATLLQGLAIWVSDAQVIVGVSDSLVNLVVRYRVLGIPYEFFYALILTVVVWLVFQYTPWGRRTLYVGKNPEVARLSGVGVGRSRTMALVVAGLISAAAGVVYTGTSGTASATSGLSYLLPAFAATFLGSTAIKVGEFNPWGTWVAAYFLISGVTGLAIIGFPTYAQQLFYGAALIIAVTVSRLAVKRSEQLAI